jgi:DNA repair exonuclease SbcCD nuclease subunit
MKETPFRVLAVGDGHLKANAAAEYKDMIRIVTKIAKESDPDLIVMLGDTLHDKQIIKMKSLCDAVNWFNELRKVAPLAILIGNHDRERERDFDPDVHPFTAVKYWKDNVMVVDKAKDMTFDADNGTSLRFVFVPYVESGKFRDELDKLKVSIVKARPRAIFAHQEFKGGIISGNNISTKGDIWTNEDPLVISGHLHKHHQPQDNIYYTGTVRQISVDEDEDKGLTIFDFYKDDHEVIRVPLKIGLKRILPIHYDDLHNYIPPSNIQVVLRVTGPLAEVNAHMKSPTVKKLRSKGVRIEPSPSPSSTKHKHSMDKLSFIDTFISLLNDDRSKIVLDRILARISN